jgi:hypothetical protein
LESILPNHTRNQTQRILSLKEAYIRTIDPVIRFLQYKNPTLAYAIAEGDYLPQAGRFSQLEDLDWAFGTLSVQDKARHLATLYLEDLGDLIQDQIDPHFGFSRYAERLGRSATHFQPLLEALNRPLSPIDIHMIACLDEHINRERPQLVCLSVPFPGNLFGALRIGQHLKSTYPQIKIAMGGGYPNTELRSLSDPRVFDFVDFITLDDGEQPLLCLLDHLSGKRTTEALKRTFIRQNGQVVYTDSAKESDIPFSQTGTPTYEGLPLDKYLSVIEVANPMHRLWSDGRWNKLTMAHGCYWKKCSFCDISLDYIRQYDPVNAAMLCDRMEEMIAETGETGFHFVDEAAPPALMKELALEILRRKLTVTWWTNIRFEQRFTSDLCQLLRASGCIAVSGGLEVASDRLLALMEKGVTVEQVARVATHFTEAGIMVHAYLMYGFPTQSEQETIDSLEIVRQLFEQGAVQSAFWHLFAMTAHSPVGLNPAKYGVIRTGPEEGQFANNDLSHEDPTGADHERYGDGLRKALFNYMHGIGYEYSLQEWFSFKVPRTTLPPHFIARALQSEKPDPLKESTRLIWLGKVVGMEVSTANRKGKSLKYVVIRISTLAKEWELSFPEKEGRAIYAVLERLKASLVQKITVKEVEVALVAQGVGSIYNLWFSKHCRELKPLGLLAV